MPGIHLPKLRMAGRSPADRQQEGADMFRRAVTVIWIPIILTMVLILGCDPNQDSPDYATVTGQVFTDSTMTVGVEGVAIIVEADPTSELPFTGPDQFTWTGQDGSFSVSFYLGHDVESSGVITHHYIADCAVSYWYHGRSFAWTGGVTVGSGEDYSLPNVHLGQFE